MSRLRIGTRGSRLAVTQAARVRALLTERGVDAELVRIRTSGDAASHRPLTGTKGLFTKEIEDALLDGRVDVAVHSLKDLLTEVPTGLVLAAFPERADPRDALVSRSGADLVGLAPGARVGTSSPRRHAALVHARPDLAVVPLRGNVPTRIGRVDAGELEAAVLAMAGLERLGLANRGRPLDPIRFVPAAGQGTLAVQVRADDGATLDTVGPLDRPDLRVQAVAERSAVAGLEAGCRAPVGAHCRREGGTFALRVHVYASDGSPGLSSDTPVDPDDPAGSGSRAADELLQRGAADLIAVVRK